MDTFFKGAALALVCVILFLILSKQNRDMAAILSVTACCLLGAAAFGYLDAVIDLINHLTQMGNLDSDTVQILLKATGIGILSEFCVMICNDAGNSALGKGIQFLGAAAVLWLSIPLFSKLMELVSNLLKNA